LFLNLNICRIKRTIFHTNYYTNFPTILLPHQVLPTLHIMIEVNNSTLLIYIHTLIFNHLDQHKSYFNVILHISPHFQTFDDVSIHLYLLNDFLLARHPLWQYFWYDMINLFIEEYYWWMNNHHFNVLCLLIILYSIIAIIENLLFVQIARKKLFDFFLVMFLK
jgi:hypothetical protein